MSISGSQLATCAGTSYFYLQAKQKQYQGDNIMFKLFRNQEQKPITNRSVAAEDALANPSYLFSLCGPAMNELWKNLVKGENAAVSQYEKFCNFEESNNSLSLSELFNKPLLYVASESDDSCITLTRGQVAYLSTFCFDKDIYISDKNESQPYLLSHTKLDEAINNLSSEEIKYRDKIVDFFENNIVPKINKVSDMRWGEDICKHSIPLNTIKCDRYHKYINEGNYDYENGEFTKWNYISYAPIYEHETNRNNPIVPVKINDLNVQILDCLCYINIALPTLDILKLLHYRGEKGSIKECVENTFGPGVFNFMKRCVADCSCANFRKWVSMGLMIQ